MKISLYKLFHLFSKDKTDRGQVYIPNDSAAWPDSWKTVEYKTYPRFSAIKLPEVAIESHDLFETILGRTSGREYSNYPITKRELAILLKYACGITSDTSRAQPSGGGRYPLEMYVFIFFSEELTTGIYHYSVKEHSLTLIEERDFNSRESRATYLSYEWGWDASVLFAMTAVFGRTERKYGSRGYRYILLEAGHVGQNVYLVSGALGLQCCGMGGTCDEAIETALDIDGNFESLVYGLVVGK